MLGGGRYKCECGLTFPRSQDKASHCKHCKVHIFRRAEHLQSQLGGDVTSVSGFVPVHYASAGPSPSPTPLHSFTPHLSTLLRMSVGDFQHAVHHGMPQPPPPPPQPQLASLLPMLSRQRSDEEPEEDGAMMLAALATAATSAPKQQHQPARPTLSALASAMDAEITQAKIARLLAECRPLSVLVVLGSEVSDGSLADCTACLSWPTFAQSPSRKLEIFREHFVGMHHPTIAHFLLRILVDCGVLQRVYTANIDDMERAVGVPSELVHQINGSIRKFRCTRAGCPGCQVQDSEQQSRAMSAACVGVLPKCGICGNTIRPCVVFAGENAPSEHAFALEQDLSRCDLLLVLGTPPPLSSPVGSALLAKQDSLRARRVPQVFLGAPQAILAAFAPMLGNADLCTTGSCQEETAKLVFLAGWQSAMQRLTRLFCDHCKAHALPTPEFCSHVCDELLMVGSTVFAPAPGVFQLRPARVLGVIDLGCTAPLYRLVFEDGVEEALPAIRIVTKINVSPPPSAQVSPVPETTIQTPTLLGLESPPVAPMSIKFLLSE